MKILAVDTSTASGSIALLEGSHLRAEWTLNSAQTHNRRLLKSVDTFLREVGWSLEQVDGYAVTIGPGSFTGLRIGLTTLKTLAWVMKKPLAGIPSLDALTAPLSFSSIPVCGLIDARKKEVYCAIYKPDGSGRLRLEGSYLAIPPAELAKLIITPTLFCGDGYLAYRDYLKDTLGELIVPAPSPYHVIRASHVADLAGMRFAEGKAEDPMRSVPLYVRPSEAEIHYPHLSPKETSTFARPDHEV